ASVGSTRPGSGTVSTRTSPASYMTVARMPVLKHGDGAGRDPYDMVKLIYSAITSLDGYIEDTAGKFGWAKPDEEVHRFVNDLERPIGTYLYGRRMYETMVYWERPPGLAEQPPVVQDFAEIWQSADKIVYSRTVQTPTSARTRIERDFDPEAVRWLKATADRDLSVGGPELA